MQRPVRWWLAALAAVLIAGCGGSDDDEGGSTSGSPSCDPSCGACQACDTSGPTPVCVELCGDGTTCQDGECVAPEGATCAPACGDCQICDTSGAAPSCVDACSDGTECQDGACVAEQELACDPGCGACQMCDTSGAAPVCVDYCADGTECQNGECVASAQTECDPSCGPCQMCDTSGAAPVCVDYCADGTECQNGECVASAQAACDPACGPCQMCDTSGTEPACVDLCGEGVQCTAGACVLPDDPCGGACASCETCDTAHGVPTCVDACMNKQTCDKTAGVCRPDTPPTGFDHSTLPELQGPFTADVAGGKAVTAQCLKCHDNAGEEMLGSAHWNWLGETPNMAGDTPGADVGKKNLVNNFCVAVPSNEKRCSQCHAGYGYADDTFDFSDKGSIDCLACHAGPYSKAPKTAGGPNDTVDMAAAAKSVGRPTRAMCGRCHFNAGGGDNVKKGDLGSALASPDADTDVHMGHATAPMDCASCHVATAHKLPGQGVHIPVNEGRFDCIDCHGSAPHGSDLVNNHAMDIACQTCHIPAFSRQQPTKMDWDWSTAGDRSRGVNGVETDTLADGTVVTVYDAMKGDFVWEKGVRPEYAWYDGRVARMTLQDTYPSGQGTQADPVRLGEPIAEKDDPHAMLFPFKVMRGRQPVDTTERLVLAPQLFGPGGFWATIPATYDAQTVEDNWTAALTAGARYAGQIGSTESFTGRATGSKPWDWAYTEMWMGINHEVAPKGEALGCNSCHSGATGWDWVALGYACDPMTGDPEQCGSRHP